MGRVSATRPVSAEAPLSSASGGGVPLASASPIRSITRLVMPDSLRGQLAQGGPQSLPGHRVAVGDRLTWIQRGPSRMPIRKGERGFEIERDESRNATAQPVLAAAHKPLLNSTVAVDAPPDSGVADFTFPE